MKRRDLLAVLGAGLVAPLVSFAQEQARDRRIGILSARSRPTPQKPDPFFDTFVLALREHGYAEGKNLVIEWRFADGKYDRLSALAAELVGANVEVIVTHLTAGVLAAQRATRTVPIVSLSITDPVGRGFAASLARPGGNVTGLTLIVEDIYPKQLELLRIMLPKATRVAFLLNPGNPTMAVHLQKNRATARRFGMTILPVEASTVAELEGGFAAMARERSEALVVVADGVFIGFRRQITELAARHRLPSVFYYREDVQAGALMSYGQNIPDFYRSIAVYVDKILKGAKPGDLPIEQPSKIHLAINRKTAKALGIVVPQDLLLRADELID